MAYDEKLAGLVRKLLTTRKGITEKKMFGGIAFLSHGNMCRGVHGRELIVRLSPDGTNQALAKRHTRIFDLSGRPMKGWILVEPAGLANQNALANWVRVSVSYAESLPPKTTGR